MTYKILVISNLCIGTAECLIDDEKIIKIFDAYFDRDYKIILNGNTFDVAPGGCFQNQYQIFNKIIYDHQEFYTYIIEKIKDHRITCIIGSKDQILSEYAEFQARDYYDVRGIHIEFGSQINTPDKTKNNWYDYICCWKYNKKSRIIKNVLDNYGNSINLNNRTADEHYRRAISLFINFGYLAVILGGCQKSKVTFHNNNIYSNCGMWKNKTNEFDAVNIISTPSNIHIANINILLPD